MYRVEETPMLVWMALAGCVEDGAKHGVDVEEVCVGEEGDLAMDEASPLGFAPADVVAGLSAGFTAPLTWETTGGATSIVFTFAEGDGTASFVDYETAPDASTACEQDDGVWVRVTGAWATADGDLDHHQDDAAVFATAVDRVELTTNVHPDELADTHACAVGEGFELEMNATFAGGVASGQIVCEGTGSTTIARW